LALCSYSNLPSQTQNVDSNRTLFIVVGDDIESPALVRLNIHTQCALRRCADLDDALMRLAHFIGVTARRMSGGIDPTVTPTAVRGYGRRVNVARLNPVFVRSLKGPHKALSSLSSSRKRSISRLWCAASTASPSFKARHIISECWSHLRCKRRSSSPADPENLLANAIILGAPSFHRNRVHFQEVNVCRVVHRFVGLVMRESKS